MSSATVEELQRCIESQGRLIRELCALAEVKTGLDAPMRRKLLDLARTVMAPTGHSLDEKNWAATLLAQLVVKHVAAPGPVSVPNANPVDVTMTTGGKRVS